MKRHCWFLISAAILLLFAAHAAAGGKVAAEIHSTEWTWEGKNIAAFGGSVSSEEPLPDRVLLRLSFTASPEYPDPGEVVFSSVNGKKLTIRKQKPEYTLDTEGITGFQFVGSWKTPENTEFTRLEITFQLFSEDGSTLLAEARMAETRSASELAMNDDGKFRIRADFSAWTTWLAIAAAVVWAAAVFRIVFAHRNKTKEM